MEIGGRGKEVGNESSGEGKRGGELMSLYMLSPFNIPLLYITIHHLMEKRCYVQVLLAKIEKNFTSNTKREYLVACDVTYKPNYTALSHLYSSKYYCCVLLLFIHYYCCVILEINFMRIHNN